MNPTRRDMLAACAAAVPALCGLPVGAAPPSAARPRLGVVAYSYAIRLAADRASGKPGLTDPLALVEHCHEIGAGGAQVGLGVRDGEYAARLRSKVEGFGMYLEGIVALPKDRADVERFAAEVRTAKAAGATVLRTASLNSRRYETFTTLEAFRRWQEQAARSLALAEPVVAREDVRLAVENHKDRRSADLAAVLERLDSRHVGACVDTGNNIALLEDPLEVVEALAPWAFSTHLKDMAVAEYEDGFLLAEVPLGQGILDLAKIVGTLRRAHPEVHFNLEMITRDPLKVPCLTPQYWVTFANLPGRDLARTLALVRKRQTGRPLTKVSGMARERQLDLEESNVRSSLAYAREHLL
ncbi:MAG TPA: TIM barrel protein [Gemmataceae bacterium]|nr:TIM barrel protein [Gemmataceae bacterium]